LKLRERIVFSFLLLFIVACSPPREDPFPQAPEERLAAPGWQPPAEEPVFCTADVQECPDGSFVARQPPDCAFAPCPEQG